MIALLQTMPPDVADVLRKPIPDVLQARSGQPAVARRAGRPVDHRQLHRDDPRHHPPRLRRPLQRAPSGNIGWLDRHDLRLGADDPARVQRVAFLSSVSSFVVANLPGADECRGLAPCSARAGADPVRLALPAVLRADARATAARLPQMAGRRCWSPSGGWRPPRCCRSRSPASAATTSPTAALPA
jgi:hypothetical protein